MSRPDPLAEPIPAETLLSALGAVGRAGVYLSPGHGPGPSTRAGEPLDHVRVALFVGAAFAAIQAAGEAWLDAARPAAPWPMAAVDPDELVSPSAGSPWSAIAAAERAALLGRGIALLDALAPEVGVFHLSDAMGAPLLARVRAGAAAGVPSIDAVVLDHLMYAAITARLLRRPGEVAVVAGSRDGGWSLRPAFPEHATMWRRALVCAPPERVHGLGFARLAELVVRALLARRSGAEPPATSPTIAASLSAGEAAISPRIVNLLGDGDRVPVRN